MPPKKKQKTDTAAAEAAAPQPVVPYYRLLLNDIFSNTPAKSISHKAILVFEKCFELVEFNNHPKQVELDKNNLPAMSKKILSCLKYSGFHLYERTYPLYHFGIVMGIVCLDYYKMLQFHGYEKEKYNIERSFFVFCNDFCSSMFKVMCVTSMTNVASEHGTILRVISDIEQQQRAQLALPQSKKQKVATTTTTTTTSDHTTRLEQWLITLKMINGITNTKQKNLTEMGRYDQKPQSLMHLGILPDEVWIESVLPVWLPETLEPQDIFDNYDSDTLAWQKYEQLLRMIPFKSIPTINKETATYETKQAWNASVMSIFESLDDSVKHDIMALPNAHAVQSTRAQAWTSGFLTWQLQCGQLVRLPGEKLMAYIMGKPDIKSAMPLSKLVGSELTDMDEETRRINGGMLAQMKYIPTRIAQNPRHGEGVLCINDYSDINEGGGQPTCNAILVQNKKPGVNGRAVHGFYVYHAWKWAETLHSKPYISKPGISKFQDVLDFIVYKSHEHVLSVEMKPNTSLINVDVKSIAVFKVTPTILRDLPNPFIDNTEDWKFTSILKIVNSVPCLDLTHFKSIIDSYMENRLTVHGKPNPLNDKQRKRLDDGLWLMSTLAQSDPSGLGHTVSERGIEDFPSNFINSGTLMVECTLGDHKKGHISDLIVTISNTGVIDLHGAISIVCMGLTRLGSIILEKGTYEKLFVPGTQINNKECFELSYFFGLQKLILKLYKVSYSGKPTLINSSNLDLTLLPPPAKPNAPGAAAADGHSEYGPGVDQYTFRILTSKQFRDDLTKEPTLKTVVTYTAIPGGNVGSQSINTAVVLGMWQGCREINRKMNGMDTAPEHFVENFVAADRWWDELGDRSWGLVYMAKTAISSDDYIKDKIREYSANFYYNKIGLSVPKLHTDMSTLSSYAYAIQNFKNAIDEEEYDEIVVQYQAIVKMSEGGWTDTLTLEEFMYHNVNKENILLLLQYMVPPEYYEDLKDIITNFDIKGTMLSLFKKILKKSDDYVYNLSLIFIMVLLQTYLNRKLDDFVLELKKFKKESCELVTKYEGQLSNASKGQIGRCFSATAQGTSSAPNHCGSIIASCSSFEDCDEKLLCEFYKCLFENLSGVMVEKGLVKTGGTINTYFSVNEINNCIKLAKVLCSHEGTMSDEDQVKLKGFIDYTELKLKESIGSEYNKYPFFFK